MRSRNKNADPRVLPEVSPALLKHLEDAFPNRLPSEAKATEKELWAKLGEQRVVEHLRTIKRYHDRQDEH